MGNVCLVCVAWVVVLVVVVVVVVVVAFEEAYICKILDEICPLLQCGHVEG